MSWKSKEILKITFALVIQVLFLVIFVCLLMSAILENDEFHPGIILFIFLVLYCVLLVIVSVCALIKTVQERNKINSMEGLRLPEMEKYSSYQQIQDEYKLEVANLIYIDEKIAITERFLCIKDQIFVLDGILDAKVVVNKTNFIIEDIELRILYCNKKDYKAVYKRRSIPQIKQVEKDMSVVCNILKEKCSNLKKFKDYQL